MSQNLCAGNGTCFLQGIYENSRTVSSISTAVILDFLQKCVFFPHIKVCLCGSCRTSQLHLAGKSRTGRRTRMARARGAKPGPCRARLEGIVPAWSNSVLVSAGVQLMPPQYLSQCSVSHSECKWC